MGTEKNTDAVQVRLLGGFSATYRGSEIIDSKHSVSQYASLMHHLWDLCFEVGQVAF